MSVSIYVVVVYGKVIEHKRFIGKDCCVTERKSYGHGKFCKECGAPLHAVVENDYIYDVYPEEEYGTYDYAEDKYLVGKELHRLDTREFAPMEELKTLTKEEESKVDDVLGQGCKYYIWEYCPG